jgi:hypothetical protein
MKIQELRKLVREVLEEELTAISSTDVNNLLKLVKTAVEAGKEVTVDGVKIAKVVIPAGAFMPADGGASLKIKDYIATPEKIVIDGVPASKFTAKPVSSQGSGGRGMLPGATPMGYGGPGFGKGGGFYAGD